MKSIFFFNFRFGRAAELQPSSLGASLLYGMH